MPKYKLDPVDPKILSPWLTYPYICKYCDIGCSSMHMIREHSKQIHGTCMGLQCADCEETVDCFRDFVYHVTEHRTELWRYCPFCPCKLDSFRHLSIHDDSQTYCKYCGEINPDIRDHQPSQYSAEEIRELSITRLKSLNIVSGVIASWKDYPWICYKCNSQYIDQYSLKDHVKEVHKECFATKCVDCYEELHSFQQFLSHVRLHRPVLRKYCEYCDYSFKDEKQRRKHFTAMHKLKYKCKTCSEFFNAEWRMLRHERNYVHNIELSITTISEGYSCKRCGETFKMFRSYQNHKKREQYKCDDCRKVYLQINNLIQHIGENHNSIKTVERCLVCGKRFYIRGLLFDHSYVCSGIAIKRKDSDQVKAKPGLERITISKIDRTFLCEPCSKSCKHDKNKNWHEFLHSDSEIFCRKCYKMFPNSIQYLQHMKDSHSRKYYCKRCELVLTFESNCKFLMELSHKSLKNEIALVSHLDNTPKVSFRHYKSFECHICNKKYKFEKCFKKHMYIKHNINNLSEQELAECESGKQDPEPNSALDKQQPDSKSVISLQQLQPDSVLLMQSLLVSIPNMQQSPIESASTIEMPQPDSLLANHQSQLVGQTENQAVSVDINDDAQQKKTSQENCREAVNAFDDLNDFDPSHEQNTIKYCEQKEAISVPCEQQAVAVPLYEQQQQVMIIPFPELALSVQQAATVPCAQQDVSTLANTNDDYSNHQSEQQKESECSSHEEEGDYQSNPCESEQEVTNSSHEQPTVKNLSLNEPNQVVSLSYKQQINSFYQQEQNALVTSFEQQRRLLSTSYLQQIEELPVFNEEKQRDLSAGNKHQENHDVYEQQERSLNVSVLKHMQTLKVLYEQQLEALSTLYGQQQESVRALTAAIGRKLQIRLRLNKQQFSSGQEQQRFNESTVNQAEAHALPSLTQPLSHEHEQQQPGFSAPSNHGQISNEEGAVSETDTQPLAVSLSLEGQSPTKRQTQELQISIPTQIAVSASSHQQMQPLSVLYVQQPFNESHQQQVQGLYEFHDQQRAIMSYEQQILSSLAQQQQQYVGLPHGQELQNLIVFYDQQKLLLGELIKEKRLALNSFQEQKETVGSSYQQQLQTIKMVYEQKQQGVNTIFEQRPQNLSALHEQRQEAVGAYEPQVLAVNYSCEQQALGASQQKDLSAVYEQEKEALRASYEQLQLDIKSVYDQRLQAINLLYGQQQQNVNQQPLQALNASYEEQEQHHAVTVAAERQQIALLELQQAVLEQQQRAFLEQQQRAPVAQQYVINPPQQILRTLDGQPVTESCGKHYRPVVVVVVNEQNESHRQKALNKHQQVVNSSVEQQDVSEQQERALDIFFDEHKQAINYFYAEQRKTVKASFEQQLRTVRSFYEELQRGYSASTEQQKHTTNEQGQQALCAAVQLEAECEKQKQAITTLNEAEVKTIALSHEQQLCVTKLHKQKVEAKISSYEEQIATEIALIQKKLETKIASYRQPKQSEDAFREQHLVTVTSCGKQAGSISDELDQEVICISSDEDEKPLSELPQLATSMGQQQQAICLSSQPQPQAKSVSCIQQPHASCTPSLQQHQVISTPFQQQLNAATTLYEQQQQAVNTQFQQQQRVITLQELQSQDISAASLQQPQAIMLYEQQPLAINTFYQQQPQAICVPSMEQPPAISMPYGHQQQVITSYNTQQGIPLYPQQPQTISATFQQMHEPISAPSQQLVEAIYILPDENVQRYVAASCDQQDQAAIALGNQEENSVVGLQQNQCVPYEEQHQAEKAPDENQELAVNTPNENQQQDDSAPYTKQLRSQKAPCKRKQETKTAPNQINPEIEKTPKEALVKTVNELYNEQEPAVSVSFKKKHGGKNAAKKKHFKSVSAPYNKPQCKKQQEAERVACKKELPSTSSSASYEKNKLAEKRQFTREEANSIVGLQRNQRASYEKQNQTEKAPNENQKLAVNTPNENQQQDDSAPYTKQLRSQKAPCKKKQETKTAPIQINPEIKKAPKETLGKTVNELYKEQQPVVGVSYKKKKEGKNASKKKHFKSVSAPYNKPQCKKQQEAERVACKKELLSTISSASYVKNKLAEKRQFTREEANSIVGLQRNQRASHEKQNQAEKAPDENQELAVNTPNENQQQDDSAPYTKQLRSQKAPCKKKQETKTAPNQINPEIEKTPKEALVKTVNELCKEQEPAVSVSFKKKQGGKNAAKKKHFKSVSAPYNKPQCKKQQEAERAACKKELPSSSASYKKNKLDENAPIKKRQPDVSVPYEKQQKGERTLGKKRRPAVSDSYENQQQVKKKPCKKQQIPKKAPNEKQQACDSAHEQPQKVVSVRNKKRFKPKSVSPVPQQEIVCGAVKHSQSSVQNTSLENAKIDQKLVPIVRLTRL